MDVNYMDMYRCDPYHFMEICNPPVNESIGSYQIHHLKHFPYRFAVANSDRVWQCVHSQKQLAQWAIDITAQFYTC